MYKWLYHNNLKEMGHYLQNQKDGNGKHLYLSLKELSVRFKGIVPTRARDCGIFVRIKTQHYDKKQQAAL